MQIWDTADIPFRLHTAGILYGRARQGWSGGWALPGYSVLGHCRDTLRLGTPWVPWGWILCGWALHEGRREH